MRLPKALRNLIIPLPEDRVAATGTGVARDQTRIARARLAELSLKMHAHSQERRVSDPATSLRSAQDDAAS